MASTTYAPKLTPGEELARSACDRCIADGRVLLAKGRQRLVFCGHDYRGHEEALVTDGWKVIADSRPELSARVSPSVI